jgi:hypothetical protein
MSCAREQQCYHPTLPGCRHSLALKNSQSISLAIPRAPSIEVARTPERDNPCDAAWRGPHGKQRGASCGAAGARGDLERNPGGAEALVVGHRLGQLRLVPRPREEDEPQPHVPAAARRVCGLASGAGAGASCRAVPVLLCDDVRCCCRAVRAAGGGAGATGYPSRDECSILRIPCRTSTPRHHTSHRRTAPAATGEAAQARHQHQGDPFPPAPGAHGPFSSGSATSI